MASAAHSYHHDPLHERIARRVGADVRLLYGIGVPMLATIGFIVALAVSGQSWMVVAVIAFLIVTLGVVVLGFYGMLGEDDEERTD
jgi:hypothetical protein